MASRQDVPPSLTSFVTVQTPPSRHIQDPPLLSQYVQMPIPQHPSKHRLPAFRAPFLSSPSGPVSQLTAFFASLHLLTPSVNLFRPPFHVMPSRPLPTADPLTCADLPLAWCQWAAVQLVSPPLQSYMLAHSANCNSLSAQHGLLYQKVHGRYKRGKEGCTGRRAPKQQGSNAGVYALSSAE